LGLEELFKSQRELKDLKINNPNEYNKKFEYVMRR